MRTTRMLTAVLALLLSATFIPPAAAQGRAWRDDRKDVQSYDRAFQLGYSDGVNDARQGHTFDLDRDARRSRATPAFRRGYAEGYQSGFRSFRSSSRNLSSVAPYVNGQARGGYQDPALSRGLSEGYKRGFEDGRDRDRYDAVRHGEYRDGDNGYFSGYGSKDAYKNNYRDGFRQGYEEGYRAGSGPGARR